MTTRRGTTPADEGIAAAKRDNAEREAAIDYAVDKLEATIAALRHKLRRTTRLSDDDIRYIIERASDIAQDEAPN